MTDEAHTTEFEFENSTETDSADIYVDETFVNGYGDTRAYIDGDTYEAKDAIKFDWDITHHDFDGQSKRWVVDGDKPSLDRLEEELNKAGYTFDKDLGEGPADDALAPVAEFAEADDDIIVEYEQKNGEGSNDKTGRVVAAELDGNGEPRIAFRRHDDNHFMYIETDRYGKTSLYTGRSTSPFVGAVERITIETEDDREVQQAAADGPEETAEADETDGPDANDLPWNNGADA